MMIEQEIDRNNFSLPELHLLMAAFDANTLFAIPDKTTFILDDDDVWQTAQQQLQTKGILNNEGISVGGAFVVNSLKKYYKSDYFVRIQNLLFGFNTNEPNESTLIVEVEVNKYFQIFRISTFNILTLLIEKLPFIKREPLKNETKFLLKELSNARRHQIEEAIKSDELLNLEIFNLNQKPHDMTNSKFYQQWLFIEDLEQLIAIDPITKRYYLCSQYWFVKLLFESLFIPYKEGR